MGFKHPKICFLMQNYLILLQLFCVIIGLLPIISAEEAAKAHDQRIAEAKTKLLKLIQKETFQLTGFEEFARIPITYPLDICLMEVSGYLYAVCLARKGTKNRNETVLKVLRKVPEDPKNPLYDYVEVFSYNTRLARSIDCISMGNEGYISVVNRVRADHQDDNSKGSPIFQLRGDAVVPVQYFDHPRQNRMHFLKYHNELLMWQTFRSGFNSSEKSYCPIMKWHESKFIEIDNIPCMNAMKIEPFAIDHQIYVAVANFMDEHQNIETHSTIFHYDITTHKFNLTQKIKTYGAIDMKHVEIENNHFLFVANSYHPHGSGPAMTSNAVVYRFEHSKFVPLQILTFDAEVMQFQPYPGEHKEFVLLITMKTGRTKTYQFDGFNFFETPITFTGGSFGKGVANMRTYKINNDFSVLIVANSEMFRDAPNLYRVKFTMTLDYDFSRAFDMFETWFAGVQEKIKTDRIVEIHEEIQALQPPPGFGNINLENSRVNTIFTETLTSTSIPIDFNKLKKYMQRAEELLAKDVVRRPKRLNDSMLPNDLNSTQLDDESNDELEMSARLSVDELIVSESVIAEFINGHRMQDLVQMNSNLDLKSLTVDHLIIKNDTKNFEELEKKLLDSEDRVKRETPANDSEPLVFNNIQVQRINGIDFDYLYENALKTNVDNQVLKGSVIINNLTADSFQTFDGQLSGMNISNIARNAKDEMVLIRSPIRFTQSLNVNRLTVNQRLNQIAIKDGKIDALFKRSKRVQEITGRKEFRSINLLNPIILQGKINMSKPFAEKISPVAVVNEDIVLQGNFHFTGNVTVEELSVQNIYGKSLRYSALQVLEDGLRIDETFIDLPMEFVQPMQIDDIEPGTSINGVPIESLIRIDTNETQIITAPKTFTADQLFVEGDLSATEINGINLQVLNSTTLKRSGRNQIITGNIQFAKITAKNVRANKIFFGKTPIDRLLTLDTEQEINGNVTIHGNVTLTPNSNVHINNLITDKPVFGIDLGALLDDCYFYQPNDTIVITSPKYFENVTIDRLLVSGDFWQTGETFDEVEQRLQDLDTNLTLTGNFTFQNKFNIKNLTVTNTINDIPSDRFGKEWLLSEGPQTFTVPQNFTDVTFVDNVQLYGLLNGYDLPDLVADTVLIYEPVTLKHVVFDKVIFEKSLNVGGKLSGIQIPDDLILSRSDSIQNFNEPVSFGSKVDIHGTLTIGDKLNDNHLAKLCELFEPAPGAWLNLTIKGDVIFNESPTPEYLNSELFTHLQQSVWFVDDTSVNFTSSVHFDSVIFEKPITTAGLVNGIDLQDLNNRYFSRSKPQKITTPMRFRGGLVFQDTIEIDSLSLGGVIKVPNSDITLNITDFDQNVLKNTKDTQYIRGPWRVNEMRILGSLSSTTINGLNLATDVVRYDSPSTNIIRAPKRFESLSIDRLACSYGCTIQGVDMVDWMSKSVMIGLNHTIQGTVYVRDAIVSNIHVLGLVNNQTFDSQHILLKNLPQTITGTLTLGNSSEVDKIQSITFDNLNVNFINEKNVSEFFENLILSDDHGDVDAGEIFTNLEFMDRLEIDELDITGSLNGIDINQIRPTEQNMYMEQYRLANDELDRFVDKLSTRTRFQHFDHVIIWQYLSTGIQGLRKLSGYDFEFVALNNSNIEFYVWNETVKALQYNNKPLALPENLVVIDLTVLEIDLMHLLVVQMQNLTSGQFVQYFFDYSDNLQLTKLVYKMSQDDEMSIEPLNLDHHHCFILYRKFNATRYSVHCMDIIDSESQQLSMHQVDAENVTSEIHKIISGYANTIILWYINGEIESRWYDTRNHIEYSDRGQFNNITSVASKRFGDKAFVAVSMHLDPSDHTNFIDGVIRIYRANENRAELKHYSNINFTNAVILQCEFSKLSDRQNVLVVATRNGAEELIQIYQDKGVAGFQLLKAHGLRLKLTVPPNFHKQFTPLRRFTLFESEEGILSFIAVYSEHGLAFCEFIYVD